MAVKIADKSAVTRYIEEQAGTSTKKAAKLTNQLIKLAKGQEKNPFDVNVDIGTSTLIATVTDTQNNAATIKKFGFNLFDPIGAVKKAASYAGKKNAVREIAGKLNEVG